MLSPPLSVIASWPTPNYVDPETRGPVGKIVGLTLAGLATLILLVRLSTRVFISRGFGWDDVLIMIAFLPATGFAVAGIVAETEFQWGRHVWDVYPALFSPGLQLSLATLIMFDVATTLTKLSTLAMVYRATAATSHKKTIVFVTGLMMLLVANGLIFVTVTIFQCRPISAYWTLSVTGQNCINQGLHLLCAGILNTTTDFIVVTLPVTLMFGLRLPWKEQVIIIGLFTLGYVACGAGVARIYCTWLMTNSPDYDTTWNAWLVWLSSAIELYLGIICASVPSTRAFFHRFLPTLFSVPSRASQSARNSEAVVDTIKDPGTLEGAEGAEVTEQKQHWSVSHGNTSTESLLVQRPGRTHSSYQSSMSKELPPIPLSPINLGDTSER